MKKGLLYITFLLVCSAYQRSEAQKMVTGTVIDKKTSDPLSGASVSVEGTTKSTMTDNRGRFSIQVNGPDSLLRISYVGYQSMRVPIGKEPHLDIAMVVKDAIDLNEIVVVGYSTEKKVNLTGSVSVVTTKDIAGKPVGQTSMALQGVVPGVTVTQASGQPGADAGTIRIRGLGTLTSSGLGALIMVDGVPGTINDVDPDDIESISVLKDAAAAAIYGSRAANGVILISTKRAKTGKVSVNYNGYVGKQYPTNMPKVVNGIDHILLLNLANENSGQAHTFSNDYIAAYKENVPSDLYPNTDWQHLTMTGNGLEHNNSVSVSGGTEKVRARASFNNFKQNAVIPNTGYDRSSLRINTDINPSDRLGFKLDVRGVNALQYQPGVAPNSIFRFMNGEIPRIQEGLLSDGRYGQGHLGDNPIAAANASGYDRDRTYTAIINLQGDWKPVKGMNVNLYYSYQLSKGEDKYFRAQYQTYYGDGGPAYKNPSTVNSLKQSSATDQTKNFHAIVTYNKSFAAAHNFKLLTGYEQTENYAESYGAYRENFLLEEYPVLNNGSAINQQATGAGGSEYALISYFGRLNYDYKGKYLFEGNLRYDGSSRFAPGHRYGLFPSFSAGWRISEEDFFSNVSFINNLKLRASWGQLGNQNIGNYPFVTSVDLTRNYILNGVSVPGAAVTGLGNDDISWETTEMTNLGIDIGFWNKFSLTAEYYIRNTKNILLTLPIPASVGLSAPYQNAGRVQNKGWDVSLAYSDHVGSFNYSIQGVLSDVKNKIVDLAGTGPYINDYLIRMVGQPIDAIYGYKSDGYFQTDGETTTHATQFGTIKAGDIRYVDQNGDGIINGLDRVVLGSTIPRYTYSLNLAGSCKGFDFSVYFQGVGKNNAYLTGQGIWPFYVGGTLLESQLNYWTAENPNATYPRLTFNQQNNIQNSDFWMQNAAYLRLKNAQIGYSIPRSVLKRTFINNLRVYISGQNLLTLDHFTKGFDPELPSGTIARYPIVKVYSLGVNVNF